MDETTTPDEPHEEDPGDVSGDPGAEVPEPPAGEEPVDEGGPDEEAPPDDTGEPSVPDDGGEPVDVDDDAAWVAAVHGEAQERFDRMATNPKHRGDPNTTMAAWVLSEIATPHQQREAIEAEAEKRVATLKENGASERYIGKQLAGRIVNGKFD